jgi:hypothetical protein
VKLSEIFWLAANEYLRDHGGYSCEAVEEAVAVMFEERPLHAEDKFLSKIWDFLESLGLYIDSDVQFRVFTPGPERQGARYAWLMFASMYAEELGL